MLCGMILLHTFTTDQVWYACRLPHRTKHDE